MADHSTVTGTNVHTPYRQVFADETARLADATVYVAADLNKKALQVDANTEYRLSAITPTWTAVGGMSGDLSDDQTTTTTGAATSILFNIPTQVNGTVLMSKLSIFAQGDLNELLTYEIIVSIKRAGGGAITVDQIDVISQYEQISPVTPAVTFIVNSPNIDVTVLGVGGTNFVWRGTHSTNFITL